MITDKKKLVEAIMEHAADTSDRAPGPCWTVCCETVEALTCAYDSKQGLKAAVTKFVNWLDKLKGEDAPIWIISGYSESGDDYGPKRYDHEPTKQDMKDFIANETPEELDIGGPGDFNSYVHLDVTKL